MTHRMVTIAAMALWLVAWIHLERLFFPFQISIEEVSIPVSLSGVVYIFAGILSAYLFQARRALNS